MNLRVGLGVDTHRRIEGKPLVLGGVEIPAPFGLEAHSDGDVLAHAVLDALLGAAGLGDKGLHFPSSDPQYKNIRSMGLVARTAELLRAQGCTPVNVDVSVVCEEPKLVPYLTEMKQELSAALAIPPSRISIKGTTSERLGFTGRNEGIAAMAVALVDCSGQDHDR
jgi:2-C-methyl-D-erythritol 2,4-cyclodiphosphate synthase